jgi:MYXO-CTERM domain-containing protein
LRRLLFTALAATAIVAPAAGAATPPAAFGLRAVGSDAQAGYFVFTTAAGTSRQGTVVVSNSGAARGTVRLYTADATTGATTGTTYLTDEQPEDAGSWIVLGKTSLTLAPGKSASVPFTVKVPAGTPAGQHVGGIVAEATNRPAGTGGKGKTGVRIEIRNQAIMAVQVNVPGTPVHKLTIGRVTSGGANGFQQVIVRVSNEGNVLERPAGSVAIYGKGGQLVQTLKFTMDTFLPETSIDYPIELKKALPAGSYSAAVMLRYALGSPTGTRTATERPAFTVTPQDVRRVFTAAPTLAVATAPTPTTTTPTSTSTGGSSSGTSTLVYVVAAAVAALLLILLVYLLARRRRRPAAIVTIPAPPPHPPAGSAVGIPVPAPAPPPAPADERPPAAEPPAPELTPEPEPAPETEAPATAPACDPYHYWEVDYDGSVRGVDGVWRFPHRCKSCGLEVLARDVLDASEQAARQP